MSDQGANKKTIGDYLRELRERKNIDLKTVAFKTKINYTILKELECNNYSRIPDKTYIRGFVKSYLKEVGGDLNEALELLDATYSDSSTDAGPFENKAHHDSLHHTDHDDEMPGTGTSRTTESAASESTHSLKPKAMKVLDFFQDHKNQNFRPIILVLLGIAVLIFSVYIIKFSSKNIERTQHKAKATERERGLHEATENVQSLIMTPMYTHADASATATVTASATAAVSPTAKPTLSPTSTATPKASASATATATQTSTPKPTASATATATATAKATVAPTATPTALVTATPKPTTTATPKPTTTATPKATTTATPKPTGTAPGATPVPTPRIQNKVIEFKKIDAPLYTVVTDAQENKDPNLIPDYIKNSVTKGVENIYVNAVEGDSWVTYKSDGQEIKSFVLRKGKRLLVRGKEVKLFIGNVNAVKVFYNSKLVSAQSDTGVKSFVFPEQSAYKYSLPLFVHDDAGKVYTEEEYKNQGRTTARSQSADPL